MIVILFRGKSIASGKWVTGYYYYDGLNHNIICDDGVSHKSIGSTIGQYTGITDKNGEKVFEGDIIEDINNRIGYIAWLPQECGYVIVWKKSDSRLGHRNRGSGYNYDTTISVIGNIHDNLELLKGGEK